MLHKLKCLKCFSKFEAEVGPSWDAGECPSCGSLMFWHGDLDDDGDSPSPRSPELIASGAGYALE